MSFKKKFRNPIECFIDHVNTFCLALLPTHPPRFNMYIVMTLLVERTGNESLIMGQWLGEGPLNAIYERRAGQQWVICMILRDKIMIPEIYWETVVGQTNAFRASNKARHTFKINYPLSMQSLKEMIVLFSFISISSFSALCLFLSHLHPSVLHDVSVLVHDCVWLEVSNVYHYPSILCCVVSPFLTAI